MEIRYRPKRQESSQTFDCLNFTLVIPTRKAILETGQAQLSDKTIKAPAGFLELVAKEGQCVGLGLTLDIPVAAFLENLEVFLPSNQDDSRETFLSQVENGVDNHVEVKMELKEEHLESLVEKVSQCKISNDLMEIEELHNFGLFEVSELRLEFTNWKTLTEVVEDARSKAENVGTGACKGCGGGHDD